MSAISRIGFIMNKEFLFYTSYLVLKNMADEGILTKKEFRIITHKLMDKYHVTILSFMLDITWLVGQ